MTEDWVETCPDVMGGKPCFKGTRLPVQTIAEFVEDGYSDAEVLSLYPYLDARHLERLRRIVASAETWEERQEP